MDRFNRIAGFFETETEEINDSDGWPEGYYNPANAPFMVTDEELRARVMKRCGKEWQLRVLAILRQRQGMKIPPEGTDGIPEFSMN